MKNLLSFCLLAITFLFTSCEKANQFPEIQVDSALDYALKYATTLDAERNADNVSTYINNSPNADFVNTLEETNYNMSSTGFNHFDQAEVFVSRNENILFYPVLRNSEQNSGFLNLCMPFFRENESEEPILLLEGPGVVGASLVADVLASKGEDVEDNGVPIIIDSPGQGSFDTGYNTSFFTKKGKVEIDYDRNPSYDKKEGELHVKVTSSDKNANFEKSWTIKF